MRAAPALFAAALVLPLGACVTQRVTGPVGSSSEAALYNVQLGAAYLEQGNLPLAKEKLDRALEENPNDPNVHSVLALLYERLRDAKRADAEFRTALRLAPKNPEIANNYAGYLCRTNRVDEGVRRLLEAARDPLYRTPEVAYANAGVCLRGAHRDADAERQLKQALEVKPNFAEAAFQLGDLELSLGRVADARKRVDVYLGTYSATADLLLLGVRASRAQGDRVAAERYARRLRVDFPDSAQTRALTANPG
jgi:type IV pilus assembly protein PilF